MGDLESLMVVLAALYLAECTVWVRRGTVLFVNWWGLARTRWHVRQPGVTFGNQHGAVLFANPLPPLGSIIFGQQPPLSLSRVAALAYSAACLNPTWRPVQSARLVRFDEIKLVERDGRKVFVNGKLFLKAMSPAAARRIVQWIRQLKETAPAQREAIIHKALAASFDKEAIRARVGDFRKLSRPLRAGAISLFFLLYVVAPLAVWRFGLNAWLWPLVAGIFAHTITLAFLFRRAHRRLYPGGDEECFTPFLTMLLAPPSAIRAPDALAKHLLEDFHALAVAKVLSAPEDFREMARRVLLDLRYPMFPVCAGQDPTTVATEEWFRRALREAAETFATSAGIKIEELQKPPMPSEPAHTACCERCGAQFVTQNAVCGDCGGRPLAALPRC